jgi:hypothetical protein
MPMKKENYPSDWPAICAFIKEANHWTCQCCGRKCRRPGEKFDSQQRTLTLAHLPHFYRAPVAFVACVCAPCHLQIDAAYHARRRARSRRKRQMRAGQLPLLRPTSDTFVPAPLSAASPPSGGAAGAKMAGTKGNEEAV